MQSLSLFVKRSAVGLLRRPAATFSKTTWEEKEKSQEKVFFNKEEGTYPHLFLFHYPLPHLRPAP